MNIEYIDLHLHTNCSDGLFSPEEAVAKAKQKNLKAIAITDHDSFAAIDPARAIADGLEIITGVELSCQLDDSDIHMLAYFIDHNYPPLADKVKFYQDERTLRGEKMVQRLNELGMDLRMDTVTRIANNGAIGRPHVAEALLQEELVRTFDEAFSRFIGYHAPAYVPKTFFDPKDAIDLVHQAGGIAVMAHPATIRRDEFIPRLKHLGLDGLEVYHSKHTKAIVEHYRKLANKYDLIITGGSDWHGRNDTRSEIGAQNVPYTVLEQMRHKAGIVK